MKTKLYINGQWQSPVRGGTFDVIDPATETVFHKAPAATAEDVNLAVQAARNAFDKGSWSKMKGAERAVYLRAIAWSIRANKDRLAKLEVKDNGKPLPEAQWDIADAAGCFDFYATLAEELDTKAEEPITLGDARVSCKAVREPLGVAAAIIPWNYPLLMASWKVAPALAAGCTVVLKPSEITPATAFLLSELCIEAGLPAGVLNIVHGTGPGCGQAIVEHPGIKAISFTGGTATGRHLAATAAPLFKKLSLELGGKNPNLIFADCDLAAAVATSIRSSFANQGQICLCGSRIFIERPIYEAFKAEFLKQLKDQKIGDPLAADTKQGALVSEGHLNKVLDYIQLAHDEGGTLLAGGHRATVPGRCESGYFLEPTVFENLPFDCRINQEEIFGPVVTLTPFDTEEDVLKMANSTDYGLSATIWTTNLTRAHRVANQLHSGIVWVNTWLHRDLRTPFGGMKNSGVGREGGLEALRFFTEAQNVCVKL